MKIVVIDSASRISIRPDNAVLRNNDTFYLPNFSKDIVCDYGYVVRITRLAKCIATKFASRCYDSVTAGVTFIARDTLLQAIESGLPTDEAYCFDHSTAIGTEWLTVDGLSDEADLSAQVSDSKFVAYYNNLLEIINSAVSNASNKLTLKTGDLVFIATSNSISVKAGDTITVEHNNNELLKFEIK